MVSVTLYMNGKLDFMVSVTLGYLSKMWASPPYTYFDKALISLKTCFLILYRTIRAMLKKLLNFNITCTSNTTTFVCTVDEGFAPALDLLEFTYCTFNYTDTTKREQCKFFAFHIVNNTLVQVMLVS